MNMRVRTTYLAKCDYPGCRMQYNFWEMSRAIRYVECAHCGETVCTYYVTCPYCGYRLAVHSLPPRGEMCGLTQITTVLP